MRYQTGILMAMIQPKINRRTLVNTLLATGICLTMSSLVVGQALPARAQTDAQKSIDQRLSSLRKLPDTERAVVTKQLALDIRKLPVTADRVNLAASLANLSTEGDFGHDTLVEVATTLAEALRATPIQGTAGQPAYPYITLAQLVRYEKVSVSLKSPQFTAAMAQLEAADKRRQAADFTLTDLTGKQWTLKELQGKVVLVNFWATWCPPCRKEIPDLEVLYNRFKDQGLLVLAITDEDRAKVEPFVTKNNMTYPVLLDPGQKVGKLYEVAGIPKSLIYDRTGKLVAQTIDMRTQKQFLELLSRAGLK